MMLTASSPSRMTILRAEAGCALSAKTDPSTSDAVSRASRMGEE